MHGNSLWSGNVDELIERLELHLEQCQLHAETLARRSRDSAGADAVVQRLRARIDGLHEWRRQRTSLVALRPCQTKSSAQGMMLDKATVLLAVVGTLIVLVYLVTAP